MSQNFHLVRNDKSPVEIMKPGKVEKFKTRTQWGLNVTCVPYTVHKLINLSLTPRLPWDPPR